MANILEIRGKALLGFEGELWLDSGGYQVLRRGLQPSVDKVAEVYRRVDADFYLALDIPPSPTDPPEEAERKARATYRNYLALKPVVGDRLVPVVHVYPREDLFLRWVRRYSAEALAVGGAVPYLMPRRGARGGPRLVARFLLLARQECRCRLHLLGAGSPSLLRRLAALNALPDSADSAAWRVKAAFGKVLTPWGERAVTPRARRFGGRPISEAELLRLRLWLAARGFPLPPRLQSFEYRALVSAFVQAHHAGRSEAGPGADRKPASGPPSGIPPGG